METMTQQELDALTEEERNTLLAVLERAREFDKIEEEETHRPIEGQLLKWTNVVKGWQQRWFYLTPDVGLLHYFLSEDKKVMGPRGSLKLIGALVQPSGEDQLMFSIVPQQGEPYKLKARTAKDRQLWVDRIRRVVERHTTDVNTLVKAAAASMPREGVPDNAASLSRHGGGSVFRKSKRERTKPVITAVVTNGASPPKHLVDMNRVLHSLNSAHRNRLQIHQFIENSDKFSESTVLRYKASAQALFKLMDECYNIIGQLQVDEEERDRVASLVSINSGDKSSDDPSRPKEKTEEDVFSDTYNHISDSINYDTDENGMSTNTCGTSASGGIDQLGHQEKPAPGGIIEQERTASGGIEATGPPSTQPTPEFYSTRSSSVMSCSNVTLNWKKETITPEQGEPYDRAYEEQDESDTDIGEHKSIIMSLLGQLKLGMDLTKVVLPTFILERKSLLELFANCFSHPDIFMSIADGTSPEERILRATKWLLTSFHAGRKGSLAKKPYNPIIGEVFHCKWEVDTTAANPSTCIAQNQQGNVTFLAEQVSHHPPVSAFYADCPDKQIAASYSVWTKSKFLGISVGVDMVGVGTIHLKEHREKYHFTLPSTYGRSILTVPWSEMGGKVQVTCPQTDYTSTLVFHTKPMYGGKLHRVTGDIRDNMTAKCIYKIDGEWNGKIKFSDETLGSSEVVDTTTLAVVPKRVRPVCEQRENESRRLWRHVTLALQKNDIDTATAAKHALEERQREEGRARAAEGVEWVPTYFKREDPSEQHKWCYKDWS